MTIHRTIAQALTARNMLPSDGQCACPLCGETDFHRDDMATDAATLALHGAPVCGFCADEHAACECCGRAARYEDMNTLHGWYCKACADLESVNGYEFQRGEAKAAGHFS